MGVCASNEGGEVNVEQIRASKGIDKLLREDERRLAREVKMLLLGPGSGGKSTILKQMKLIHLHGFSPGELEQYRQQIFRNVCDAMRICLAMLDEEGVFLSDDIRDSCSTFISSSLSPPHDLRDGEPYPISSLEPLSCLWQDPGIQACVARSTNAALPENMSYFYSHLDRLFQPSGFVPTDQDVLRCRQETCGISETCFKTSDLTYRLFDVGGQRSERKKWIHCFEAVTAILFLVAISGYDATLSLAASLPTTLTHLLLQQCLIEDPDSNQLQEGLMLYDSILNSAWFVRTSIILFLNKVDIFKERILVSSVRAQFPDYQGDDSDYNAARDYFKGRFTRLNRSQSKEIYTNYTTAIDTNLMRVVMASVTDIIVTRSLNEIIL